MKKKVIALVLVCVLVFGIAVGGTLALLIDQTDAVVNTFTVGDVDIELAESTGDVIDGKHTFKIVPGVDINKDPEVTVTAGSEECFVYVKVDVINNKTGSKDIFGYNIADGWTALEGVQNVYWRKVGSDDAVRTFSVLAGDKVTVSKDLTRAELEVAKTNKPQMTVTAYAVQAATFSDAKAAWTGASFS